MNAADNINRECAPGVRREVLTADDIIRMLPKLASHRKLVEWGMQAIGLDKVNAVHSRHCHSTGAAFSTHLVEDEFRFRLRVDNEDILKEYADKAFITVSNHPYGGMDGIILLHLVGKYRPDYKVMVNMILYNITAMRPSFIPVDAIRTNDPEKKAVTVRSLRHAMEHVRSGYPIGFFPAGAVSKLDRSLHIRDREWQPTVTRLIRQLKVPVIPIYFHGHNSTFFNFLGLIDWRLRSLRLPREIFNKKGKEIHISVGKPITVDKQGEFKDYESLGEYLRQQTYALAGKK